MNIDEYIKKEKITQGKLSKYLGYSPGVVATWRTGQRISKEARTRLRQLGITSFDFDYRRDKEAIFVETIQYIKNSGENSVYCQNEVQTKMVIKWLEDRGYFAKKRKKGHSCWEIFYSKGG